MTAAPSSLADQLAAKTGLAKIIASGVIRRACLRAGISPEELTHKELPRVIDAIEPLLAIYLPPAQAAERVAELRRFSKT